MFISFEGSSKDLCMFLFFLFRYIILFVHRSCDHLVIANIVLIYLLYIYDDVVIISPISPCVVSFLSLYTCFLCMQSFISVSH